MDHLPGRGHQESCSSLNPAQSFSTSASTGYVLEMQIALSEIGGTLAAGQTLGFDLGVDRQRCFA